MLTNVWDRVCTGANVTHSLRIPHRKLRGVDHGSVGMVESGLARSDVCMMLLHVY